MTISSTTRVAGPFTGSGTTATFPFTFKTFAASDLYVATLNLATGTTAPLALTTDYTAALNDDQDTSPGGSITLTAGNLASGYTLTITTAMARLQALALANGGGFYPNVVNAALDTLTILLQQLAVQVARSLQAPLVDGSPAVTLPAAAQRAGKMLGFDSNGNISMISVAPGGTVPGAQLAIGVVDGTNSDFTFTAAAGAPPTPLVFAGGVFLNPLTDYGLPVYVGGTWKVTLNTAPVNGPVIVLQLA